MRVVLDTNVIVSGILSTSGPPAQILRAWHAHEIRVVTSPALLRELQAVLDRPHIKSRIVVSQAAVAALTDRLERADLVVDPSERIDAIAADPDDNRLLEAAVAGRAEYIVSGDAHVLALDVFRGVQIVTPARFLAVLAAAGSP